MEYTKLTDLERAADIYRIAPCQRRLSRTERLQRWASQLESRRYQKLNSLHGTEYRSAEALENMRRDNSPLTVAYQDPVLRGDGLENDTYGAARRYFGLNDAELHGVVCFCYYGETMSARVTAWRVRALIPRTPLLAVIGRAFQQFRNWCASA